MKAPKIGRQWRFVPSVFGNPNGKNAEDVVRHRVNGTIDYINWRNRWFRVRYVVHGVEFHEGFKFCYEN